MEQDTSDYTVVQKTIFFKWVSLDNICS